MIEISCEKGIYKFHVGVDHLYHIGDSFYLHSEKLGTEILLASYPTWGEIDMVGMNKFLYETDRGLRNITQILFDKNAILYAEDDYDWEDDLF